jgi:hypothetical protein
MGFFFTSKVKYSKVFFFVLENTSQQGRHICHSTFCWSAANLPPSRLKLRTLL